MGSMSNWILFMQVFFISAGVVSLAMGISFSAPMAVNEVVVIWSIIHSWLKPPYLYILINAIIITIAASSRFRQSQPLPPPPVQSQPLVSIPPPPAYFAAFQAEPEVRTILEVPTAADDGGDRVVELKPVLVNGLEVDMEEEEEEEEEEAVGDGEAEDEDEDGFVDWRLTYDPRPPERISPEFQLEYFLPPVKPTGNIPERMREPIMEASHDTLESTWKKIMEGSSRAATHEEVRRGGAPPRPPKSFKERTISDDSPPSRASSGIRKEMSPSQDELNQRVEAFIKKVNEEMRQRRQESLDQHMQMINSGA